MQITLATLIPALSIMFMASTLSGMTGFGFGLLSVPLMVLIIPPQVAVPVIRLQAIVAGAIVLWEARRWLQPRAVWPLFLGGFIGLPVGAYLLVRWDAQTLKVAIGVITVVTALAMLRGVQVDLGDSLLASTNVGFVSGVLSGSTSMGGPPVVIFFTGRGIEKQAFRANLAAFFVLQGLASIPPYLVGGLLTPTVIALIFLLLPALIVGVPLGARLAAQIDEGAFRKVVLLAVTITGLMAIVSGLRI